ncbi:helix-turn-helix domain-containing protein [Micromonospora sp. NPDC004704]
MGISSSEYLVRELKRQRVKAGLTQAQLGEKIHYSDTHVSGIETGSKPVTLAYLRLVDVALDLGSHFETMWEELIKDSALPPSWLREWIVIERDALTLRWFEQSFVPGLLQTEDYARATLRAGKGFSDDEVEQRVASRMERQALLTRANKPPQLMAVLDHAVLQRTVDDQRDLMAAQLEHLLNCADLPNVQIHVVPDSVGLYRGLAGSFIIAQLSGGATYGHVDHQIGVDVVEKHDDIATLANAWDIVMGEAIPRRQSLDLIKEVAKTWT